MKPGHDRIARHVDDLGSLGDLERTLLADGHDPVVGHDDVSLGDHLVAAHRDHLGPTQDDRPARAVPGLLDHDRHFLGLGLLCLLFGFGFLFIFSLFVVFALERGEDDRIERQAEKAGADGPGDRLAAVGPGGVVGADVGELLERHDGSCTDTLGASPPNRGRASR